MCNYEDFRKKDVETLYAENCLLTIYKSNFNSIFNVLRIDH